MVKCARILYSQGPCHLIFSHSPLHFVKCVDLTPSILTPSICLGTFPSIKRGLRGVFLFSFPSITTAFIQKNLLVSSLPLNQVKTLYLFAGLITSSLSLLLSKKWPGKLLPVMISGKKSLFCIYTPGLFFYLNQSLDFMIILSRFKGWPVTCYLC